MSASPTFLRVVVTGAAGQIAYSLLPLLLNGQVFGPKCRLELRLLDIQPAETVLEGVKMELDDCAYSLATKIVTTVDPQVAFTDADVVIQVGGFPRKQGMLRKDLIEKNVAIFKSQGEAIEKFASRDVKVLVVANPANTNCYVTMQQCPSIPKKNFSALTRLDHQRLVGKVLNRLNQSGKFGFLHPENVRNAMIWGNHSSTQYPDTHHCEVQNPVTGEWQSLEEIIDDKEWLEGSLIAEVQQRGAEVIKARKLSSALSAANAIGAHLRDWCFGSNGNYVSMAVWSEGNTYGVPDDLIYSFPIVCNGNWNYEIAAGLEISETSRDLMNKTAAELVEEKQDGSSILAASNL